LFLSGRMIPGTWRGYSGSYHVLRPILRSIKPSYPRRALNSAGQTRLPTFSMISRSRSFRGRSSVPLPWSCLHRGDNRRRIDLDNRHTEFFDPLCIISPAISPSINADFLFCRWTLWWFSPATMFCRPGPAHNIHYITFGFIEYLLILRQQSCHSPLNIGHYLDLH